MAFAKVSSSAIPVKICSTKNIEFSSSKSEINQICITFFVLQLVQLFYCKRCKNNCIFKWSNKYNLQKTHAANNRSFTLRTTILSLTKSSSIVRCFLSFLVSSGRIKRPTLAFLFFPVKAISVSLHLQQPFCSAIKCQLWLWPLVLSYAAATTTMATELYAETRLFWFFPVLTSIWANWIEPFLGIFFRMGHSRPLLDVLKQYSSYSTNAKYDPFDIHRRDSNSQLKKSLPKALWYLRLTRCHILLNYFIQFQLHFRNWR